MRSAGLTAPFNVGTGQAGAAERILEGLARGRADVQYFGWFFLGLWLHEGQVEWMREAIATICVAPTANRWGKTTLLPCGHFHANIYKTGGEPKYLDELGAVDMAKWSKLRYKTIHVSHEWETVAIVWDEAHRLLEENANLRALVKAAPKSIPPHFDFINGARWKFRTLGHDAKGIDGNSYYLISIDEAGWVEGLEKMMENVIRLRIADVLGIIWLVGTFKQGVSIDFYKYAVRASAHTGADIGLAWGEGAEEDQDSGTAGEMDATILRYLAEAGITPDEFADAVAGR